MLETIYKWDRRKFERKSTRGRWIECTDDLETIYITPEWMEEKTGESEIRFFESINAKVDVYEDHAGIIHFDNVCCDKLQKRLETFTPISLDHAIATAGYRERVALENAEYQRIIKRKETGPDHIVLEFGENDETALYDLVTRTWCG